MYETKTFQLGEAEITTNPHSNVRNAQPAAVLGRKHKYLASPVGFVDTNF